MKALLGRAQKAAGGRNQPAAAPQRYLGGTRPLIPRWAGPVFLGLTIALIPWIAYLALSLPSRTEANHYRTAWVGFDVLLVLVMARTAYLALKGHRRIELPAIATATLLIVDAWFDVTTARAGAPQMDAVLLAVFVELPTAALAIYISRRVERALDETLHGAVEDGRALGISPPTESEKSA